MTVVRLDDYYQSIAARLATTVGALDRDTFIGEPSPRMDSDGRAHPYAALYPSPGWQHGVSLGQGIDQAALTFQVTAAGGDVTRCLRAVDRVRDALTDFEPAIAGACCGRLTEPTAYDPGPVRIDTDAQPSRAWVPLLFTALIWLPEGGPTP